MAKRKTKDKAVLFEKDGGLGIVTLNRPEAYNAMNGPVMSALLGAAIACDEDDDVRAVLVTGAGPAFCAGGDVVAMAEVGAKTGSASIFLKELTVPLHGAIATFYRMAKPVVAAVNGIAAGAGFSLAMACDLVVAAESAVFTMAYTGIGAAPDGSSTYFLPRLVGTKRAYELIATNRVLSAADAKALGIVAEIFPDASFAEDARAYAARLAAGPTLALGLAKQLVASSTESSLETQMEFERRAIAACGRTEDFKEGTRAFAEKRKPAFTGR